MLGADPSRRCERVLPHVQGTAIPLMARAQFIAFFLLCPVIPRYRKLSFADKMYWVSRCVRVCVFEPADNEQLCLDNACRYCGYRISLPRIWR